MISLESLMEAHTTSFADISPTHMVESRGGGNNDEGAVCSLLEKVCEAAKSKDAATINAQLKEIKRIDAVYSALK